MHAGVFLEGCVHLADETFDCIAAESQNVGNVLSCGYQLDRDGACCEKTGLSLRSCVCARARVYMYVGIRLQAFMHGCRRSKLHPKKTLSAQNPQAEDQAGFNLWETFFCRDILAEC